MAARANTAEAQGHRERAEGMEGHRELALKCRQGKISKGAESLEKKMTGGITILPQREIHILKGNLKSIRTEVEKVGVKFTHSSKVSRK